MLFPFLAFSGGLQFVFVIGSSSYTPQTQRSNFRAMINAISYIIGKYKISPSDTQVGVVVFGRSASSPIRLGSITDKQSLLDAVGRISFPGVGAGIDMGVKEAATMLRGARKDGVAQRLVIFIDGIPRIESFDDIKATVTGLRGEDVRVTAVGIGERVSPENIRSLSSDGKGVSVNDAKDVAGGVKDLAKPVSRPG